MRRDVKQAGVGIPAQRDRFSGFPESAVTMPESSVTIPERYRPAPLPAQRYALATFKTVKAHIDYHVEIDPHRYSVPHALATVPVWVCSP
ncbi:MAG TPA: hypothetical protein VL635_20185 [Trinickia sp.]|jgi:hypothetical protein|nr:hypothetical protein [Trinickia sp.]